jgi:4-hydroxy-tetrahydrodipicolinate reductase
MSVIKVGLLGFGRTGSVVAKELVNDPGFDLRWVCRRNIQSNFMFASHALGFDEGFAPFVLPEAVSAVFLKDNPVDVLIDFSSHHAAEMYERFAKASVRIVTAISKYTAEEMEMIQCASQWTAILASPNITLGINWLIIASKVLKTIVPHADIEVVEEHFRSKPEISGTALRIADHLSLDPARRVNSIRVGGIVGRHEVIFGLPNQTIRLTHESLNRAAFGAGAMFAAKWLIDKDSGLYSMEQLFHERFVDKIKDLQFG